MAGVSRVRVCGGNFKTGAAETRGGGFPAATGRCGEGRVSRRGAEAQGRGTVASRWDVGGRVGIEGAGIGSLGGADGALWKHATIAAAHGSDGVATSPLFGARGDLRPRQSPGSHGYQSQVFSEGYQSPARGSAPSPLASSDCHGPVELKHDRFPRSSGAMPPALAMISPTERSREYLNGRPPGFTTSPLTVTWNTP
jgi:hypothetical protein